MDDAGGRGRREHDAPDMFAHLERSLERKRASFIDPAIAGRERVRQHRVIGRGDSDRQTTQVAALAA